MNAGTSFYALRLLLSANVRKEWLCLLAKRFGIRDYFAGICLLIYFFALISWVITAMDTSGDAVMFPRGGGKRKLDKSIEDKVRSDDDKSLDFFVVKAQENIAQVKRL